MTLRPFLVSNSFAQLNLSIFTEVLLVDRYFFSQILEESIKCESGRPAAHRSCGGWPDLRRIHAVRFARRRSRTTAIPIMGGFTSSSRMGQSCTRAIREI
jgi:hypothetical protein